MYSNYQSYSMPSSSFSYSSPRMSSSSSMPISMSSEDRIAGGFLGPFLLGGITGGLVAPAF